MPKKRSYNRKVEHSGRTNSRLVTAGYFVALSAFAFLVAFLSSSHFAPMSESSAEAGAYYANISSSGEVELDFVSTPDGVAKIGKDTLSVTTNATEGYKLYISTVSTASSNGLCLENDATKCVVASTGTPENPKKLAVNTWGYVPSRASSSDTASTYTDGDVDAVSGQAIIRGVPTYGHEDVLYVNSTPSVAAANSLDVYYGANVSTALPSGAYSNTVVYTAITDAPNPSSTPATIAPVSQTGLGAGEDLVVTTSLYPGLSVDNIGTISVKIGDDDCTNVTPSLGTGGELKISCKTPAKASAGTYTVAVYVAKYNKTYELSGAYEYIQETMQGFVPDASAEVGATKELMDTRDENMYKVRKLADGNWWMVQNLRLVGPKTLTSAESDVKNDFSLTASDDGTWCTTSTSACDDQSMVFDTGDASYGAYYNWYAATAGTGTYSLSSGEAGSSICPKGWTLATRNEIIMLDRSMGGTGQNRTDSITNARFQDVDGPAFVLSGSRNGSYNTAPGDIGYYWSSTAKSSSYVYSLSLDKNNAVSPQYDGATYIGRSVRCIWRETMQNFAPDASVAANTIKKLLDARDNERYEVRKLADGNWWMMQNLRLVGPRTLTSADSNVTSDFSLTASDNSTWCTTINSVACIDQSMVLDSGNQSYGAYYNWYAATAGSGTYGVNIDGTDASSSICPKGWRLPTGGSAGDFRNLALAVGSSTDISYYFGGAGKRIGGNISDRGTRGYYWSSTTYSDGNGAYNYDTSSAVNFSYRNAKYAGLSVRCILEETMQNFTPDASAKVNAMKVLVDVRDGEKYKVRKLADGNWWMIQNLRLVGPRTLTSADSNVTSDFSLTASDNSTWCTEDSSACDDQSMVLDSGDQTYGTYYNWYAATAGTGTYSLSSGEAGSSICPKGWRLPTGGSSGEIGVLSSNYADASAMMSIGGPAFTLSGVRSGDNTEWQGSSGVYWSSTATGSHSYVFEIVPEGSSSVATYAKDYGNTVRCIVSS